MIVVDASLAAKWVLWEADSPEALAFLSGRGREFGAPEIIFVEVAQAIVRRANMMKEIAADALEALRVWTALWDDQVVKPHRLTPRRLHRAGSLAIALGHPLKDCLYLDLAMEFGCVLATCDAKFAARAGTAHPDIRLLRDFS